ncbi:hypothetical protein SAMN04488490_0272 [Marinobacter sp. LV10R510-11A]|uniref:hypothetical protein n=1 Tax=Marinobacter sp. LV10R510-11A TaxID=1415568 RepID=UPI000BB77D8F|nr:hypothetical protein [Marinobacter sp. LV10R510-11A]SOB74745.1 hypothetical protein SAMN04488490_0272 [Marinobacter sp. LV10R510-11A]
MKRLITVLATTLILTACGGSENSDGSKKSTYSSCSITKSEAAFAGDRANDLKQCWDGVNYKEQNLALKWCQQKVSAYIDSEYIFGHSVELEVASTNCP